MSTRPKFLRAAATLTATSLAVLAGTLFAWSPGRPPPLTDDAGRPLPGSISEKVFVEINGIQQGMFIQSANQSNPVLLFLHGGPGMPFFFINETYPTGLERDFTVVWWEQRGAGISFSPDIPPDSMTVDQMIADTIVVTDYLRDRFKHDRIILLGHSWGSFLGIQVAQRAPDRFHAYVGMGQVSYQLQSEVATHAYLLDFYRTKGDTKMVRRLEAAPVSLTEGTSDNWMRLRDEATHRAGVGTTRGMDSVITGIFFSSLRSPAYTIREKFNIWRGKVSSRQYLWDKVLLTNLTERVTQLDVPVYFFSGLYDYTTSHELAREYFLKIRAPLKGFYTFQNSAHSALFEEPKRARQILREDVVNLKNSLADAIP